MNYIVYGGLNQRYEIVQRDDGLYEWLAKDAVVKDYAVLREGFEGGVKRFITSKYRTSTEKRFTNVEDAIEWARPICESGLLVDEYYLEEPTYTDWDDHR